MRLNRIPPRGVVPNTIRLLQLRQEVEARRAAELSLAAIDHVLYGGSIWMLDRRPWWRRLWDGFVRIATAGLESDGR